MADIFVSYSRADRDTVARIVEALKAEGWDVWWDTRLRAGEQWDEVIEREIHAAACVVVVWTQISVTRRWVREEAGFALDRNILVPLAIENAVPPLGFTRVQTANLSGWTGDASAPEMRGVIEAVREKLGHAPKPAPGPQPAPPQPDPGAWKHTLAAQEWARIESTADIAALRLFAQHFAGTYHAALAEKQAGELEAAARAKAAAEAEARAKAAAEESRASVPKRGARRSRERSHALPGATRCLRSGRKTRRPPPPGCKSWAT